MPNQEAALIRFHGNGDVRLAQVSGFLSALEETYSGISLFFTAVDAIRDWPRYPYWELPPHRRPALLGSFRGPTGRFNARDLRLSAQTPTRSRLVLKAVRLESPGWWDIFGKLNPLEVIRQGLNDRHERKKDNDYRSAAEREKGLLENEKGMLENEILRTEAIAGRIALARDLGLSDEQLAPLINDLLVAPIRSLEKFQDRGIVTTAESSQRRNVGD